MGVSGEQQNLGIPESIEMADSPVTYDMKILEKLEIV